MLGVTEAATRAMDQKYLKGVLPGKSAATFIAEIAPRSLIYRLIVPFLCVLRCNTLCRSVL